MSGEETGRTQAATPRAATPADLAVELKGLVPDAFHPLGELAREGVVASEGELRRGLVAMNGAGLIAVMTLIPQSFDAVILRAAAVLFFVGLVAACVSWVRRASASRAALLVGPRLNAWLDRIAAEPAAQKPFADTSEIDSLMKAMHKGLERISSEAQRPGRTAPTWSYVALASFCLAAALLLGNFVVSPQVGAKPSTQGCSRPVENVRVGHAKT